MGGSAPFLGRLQGRPHVAERKGKHRVSGGELQPHVGQDGVGGRVRGSGGAGMPGRRQRRLLTTPLLPLNLKPSCTPCYEAICLCSTLSRNPLSVVPLVQSYRCTAHHKVLVAVGAKAHGKGCRSSGLNVHWAEGVGTVEECLPRLRVHADDQVCLTPPCIPSSP